MSYQVLARKYRPITLSRVVGQDHAVLALTNALDLGRLHHAYMFTGTRGVGKTTIARIIAKSLNCEQGVSSKPCEECASCKEINAGQFIDLFEIDAATQTGVESTRNLLENVQYSPSRGRFKVYIIDEVHMLSESSFNALLKTLEEPPDHVKFVLATTNPRKVPVTVRSRCLQFHLKNILPEVIEQQLREVLASEGVAFEDDALKVIARMSQGSMRDALSITDQAVAHCGDKLDEEAVVDMLGLTRVDEVVSLLTLLANDDRKGVFEFLEKLAERPLDYADLLAGLQSTIHELALHEAAQLRPAENLHLLLKKFQNDWLQTAYQILVLARRDLQYAPEPRVGFEMAMIRLMDFAPVMVDAETASKPVTGHPPSEESDSDDGEYQANVTKDEQTTSEEASMESVEKNSDTYAQRRQRVVEEVKAGPVMQRLAKDGGVLVDVQLHDDRDSNGDHNDR